MPMRGQALLEAAVALGLLLPVMFGLLQFALWMHASNVVRGAVQDGARVWAAYGGERVEGLDRARTLLDVGLGADSGDVKLHGYEPMRDTVTVEAQGSLRPILPILGWRLPLEASASMSRERFRPRDEV